MTGRDKAPIKPYSMMDRILLSAFLPGAGQWVNGQSTKAWLIGVPSFILFIDAAVHTFIVALRIFAPVMAGEKLVVDENVYMIMRTLMIVLGLAMALWVYALVDTIVVARRQLSEEAEK